MQAIRSFPQLTKRCFATAVDHAPPKKLHGILGRYAGALYTAASKAKALDTVEAELRAVMANMKSSPAFAAFLANPTITRDLKSETVDKLFAEDKFSHITRNLLMTMAANGRVGQAGKVMDSYMELMEARRGVVKAVIVTAEPLNAKNAKSAEAAVGSLVGSGKKVDIAFEVDSSILGGMQIRMGDQFMDLSVASRITSINKVIETA